MVTNLPLRYEAVESDAIKDRLNEDPPRSAERAAGDIALTRVKALRSAKGKNTFKGVALIVGMGFETAAVACVAMAISHVL